MQRIPEIFIGLVGLWLALAPAGWGWRSLVDDVGEGRLLRFFLGFGLVLLAGLLYEKNRMRQHMKVLVDALNRMLYGKDYDKHREAVDLLLRAASGTNEDVRRNALASLAKVTGQAFGDDVMAWHVWWAANRSTFSLRRKGKGKGGDAT